MSLRFRLHAPVQPPALAWSETLRELAAVHRSRRTVDEASRWPLAHACTRGDRAVGGAPDVEGEGRLQSDQPFCCRALA